MNDQSHTQALHKRVYRTTKHPWQEPGLEPGNGKAAAGGTIAADQLIGQHYRLRARLGRGRLGAIYEAHDESSRVARIERRVAIQLLDEQVVATPHFTDEFERGAMTLQAISHPNIVKLLEFGRDRNRHFLVMELIEGVSLRFVLADVGIPPMGETHAVVRAVGDALRYLNAKDMVHGNLRPENVLVTYDYEVKLLDVVPVNWPSPVPEHVEETELRARITPDVRDDVYGLACLTYELLAGRHPFNENTQLEAHRAGLKLVPVDGLPPRQWRALASALALDRDHRTPTVAEFLDEFGITGVESLRAPVPGIAESRRPPVPQTPMPTSTLTARRITPTRAKRAGNGGTLLWLLVVAGLGAVAYVYHDVLRDGAAELMTAIDAKRQDLSASKTGETTAQPEVAPPPAATAETESVIEPAPLPPVEDSSTDASPAVAADHVDPAARQERLSFGLPAVAVSEAEIAARIVIQRSGDSTKPASVVWWTREGTASAEEDYADLGRRVERLAPGEQSRVIFVPLVNDSVVEPTQSFTVYLGRDDPGRSSVEPVSSMRVDIVDDD